MTAFLLQYELNLVEEDRELSLCSLPDDLVINDVVAMNQYVTKSDDLLPIANSRRNGRIGFNQPIQRFANDFKLPLNT